ncbi:MAG: NADH-quinone oxidoreductase subunit C [Thermodesulfobacteriota bacterium]
MSAANKESVLTDNIKKVFIDDIIETNVYRGEVTHCVLKRSLRSICNFLKTDPDLKMNYLVDVLGVDMEPLKPDSPRFEVVYHLYSTSKKHRIRLKIRLADGESAPTVSDIWSAANWPECEAYDMFGIVFDDHPDLKRIYLEDDWEGFPLRKDYPLKGFKDKYNPFGEERE